MKSTNIDMKKSGSFKRHNWKLFILSAIFSLTQVSCKKFIDIPPPNGVITQNSVYRADATAVSAITAIYNTMNASPIQGAGSLSIYSGLSADEYTLSANITDVSSVGYYTNTLSQIAGTNTSGGELYSPLYRFVFRTNAAIEGLNNSNSLTPFVKQQLLGEAKFMRAFFYFYLVNLFGDVPLALTTDPKVNTQLFRSPREKVYDQIVKDLLDAESILNSNYVDATLVKSTSERTRPTKWAATALLARVYLYKGDYNNAEAKSSELISNSSQFTLLPLNDVFLKNSKEAIWQIQPTAINFNTNESITLVIPVNGPDNAHPVYLSDSQLNSFELGDQRAVFGNWIDTTIYKISTTPLIWDTVAYSFKYKHNNNDPTITATTLTTNMKEYFMVLRLGEQYLIRSEARAKQNNIGGAQSDLNAIRNRAGLPNTTASNQSSLLTTILNERRFELFSEWGNRWFDLKRTGKVNEVMTTATPLKSSGTSTWQSYQQLYPIPIAELQLAPNIIQNVGY